MLPDIATSKYSSIACDRDLIQVKEIQSRDRNYIHMRLIRDLA